MSGPGRTGAANPEATAAVGTPGGGAGTRAEERSARATRTAGGWPLAARVRDRLRRDPFGALAAAVMVAAAYLCLVNLDYAALWHDEAPTALIARNLLEQGDITGWDGRNLVGGTNGRTLNDDLRDVLPPLMYAVNAASFALFGISEASARIMPALFGILSLVLLYLLLRQHLRDHPRLVFFCLLFAAWSPQLLLYFRQSRYYAFMALALIAAFYLYEVWWRSGRTWALGGLMLVAALAFFNHYAGGAATMLALAAWHLLLRWRATTPRHWLLLTAGGCFVVALGSAYLVWLGLIGGERGGFLAYTGITGLEDYHGTIPPAVLRLPIYGRDLFAADWISWPVFLWFAGALTLRVVARRRLAGHDGSPSRRSPAARSRPTPHGAPSNRIPAEPRREESPDAPPDGLPVAEAGRVVLMGALFALFSAVLSPQPVWEFPYTDLRYYMGALALLLPMKGLFVEWLWRRWKIAGGAALAVLLLTSAGAWPFNTRMLLTGERTLGLHLVQFVREIHRPYRDSIRVVSDYLLEHAGQDDLVYVPAFSDREALTFTAGERVLFCCMLNDESPLPQEAIAGMSPHLVTAATTPDWIVLFGKLDPAYMAKLADFYTVAAQLDVFYYPTQRPEINLHAFTPVSVAAPGVHILRRIPTARLQAKADRFTAAGQFLAAADAYAAVLAVDPDSAAAHAGLGRALFRLGHYAEALNAMTQATARQPDLPGAATLHRLMGQAAQQLGRAGEAAGHFERALQLDPLDTPALDRLAMVRFGQRQYAAALDLYGRLLEISPGDAQIHANVGATLYHLGRLDDAITSLERALALDPSLDAARSSLERIRSAAQQRER